MYLLLNEEGRSTRATGSHLKIYKSSNGEVEDPSSTQGDCTSQSVTEVSPASESRSFPKDDAIHVRGCM